MRVLVDSTFPESLRRVPNASGVEIDRVGEPYSDSQLLDFAAASGYAALVLLDQEMVARDEFRQMAAKRGLVLICSVSDDPFEAEANLRRSFAALTKTLAQPASTLYWLRKDGLRADED